MLDDIESGTVAARATTQIPTLGEVLDAGHPVEMRAMHPYGFRSGQWALVTGAAMVAGRSCYLVRFPDGMTAQWPRYDPNDPYEFRAVGV